MSTNPETVTIPKSEYDALLKRDEFLSCLEAAGVDNWSGYGEAFTIRDEWAAGRAKTE